MRFSTAIVAGSFAVLASAASETSAAAQPASTSAVDKCIANCPVADVNCKAHCIAVPSPDDTQANANTECARKCPQGSGSPEDTKKFGDCLAKCAHDHYYQTSVGTPESTGTPNSGNSGSGGSGSNSSAGSGGNGGDASNTSAGSSGSGSETTGTGATKPTGTSGGDNASKTGSDAKATESGKGGDKNGAAGLVASSAALFGAVVALFAL